MTTSSWPDHLLGLDEWAALEEDTSRRFELAEGVLQVAPRPSGRHQRLTWRLAAALDPACPSGWCALTGVEVVVDGGPHPTVRVPDVAIVLTDVVDDRSLFSARDVLAVIEVLSPGSRRTDRITKLADYADAGIAHYGVADPGPPVSLTEFRLTRGRYDEGTEHRGSADLDLGVGTSLDLDALLDPPAP